MHFVIWSGRIQKKWILGQSAPEVLDGSLVNLWPMISCILTTWSSSAGLINLCTKVRSPITDKNLGLIFPYFTGFKYMFDGQLVTVWSAPNYCYRCGNVASILEFTDVDNRTPKLFDAVPDNERVIPTKAATPYFLWWENQQYELNSRKRERKKITERKTHHFNK